MNAMFRLFLALAPLAVACAPTPPPSTLALPAEARPSVRAAMSAAEPIRAALAADSLDGVPAAAEALAHHLRQTQAGPLDSTARAGAEAADQLRAAPDLDRARQAFAGVSEALFSLAAADPALQAGWVAYRCPMTDHFPKWFQRPGPTQNPYMGQRMLECGSTDGWGEPVALTDPDGIAWYTCPMHPTIHDPHPDTPCPICGMALVPVTHAALASGEVRVDALRRQAFGIRTAAVVQGELDPRVRVAGVVQVDERARTEVTARVSGYVERLRVAETGARVVRGQPLLDLYSPELFATQQDLLRAHRDGHASQAAAARERLELWGLSSAQVDALIAGGVPQRAVPLLAPAPGTVLAKDAVQGGRVEAGQRLYALAELDRVWVELKVFEDALDRIAPGQPVQIALEASDAPGWSGVVDRVLPELDLQARAGRVRVAVTNPGELRVGSWVSATVLTDSAPALLVPRDAVIAAGPRRVVFVDRGDDRLVPTEVRLGRRGADQIEVLDGLHAGEQVVVSGNFLVAAESRLQSATGFWAGADHE